MQWRPPLQTGKMQPPTPPTLPGQSPHWLHFPGPWAVAHWRPLFWTILPAAAPGVCTSGLAQAGVWRRQFASPITDIQEPAAQYLQQLWRPGRGTACQNLTGQNRQDWAGPGRAEQAEAVPGGTGQGRTGRRRKRPSRTVALSGGRGKAWQGVGRARRGGAG